MVRRYYYHLVNTWKGKTRWNLYVQANRRFSLREMLAKQYWILGHIDELPFNNVTLKIASCRESTAEVIKPIFPEPSTSAFHFVNVTLDKAARVITWEYDFVLEFVFNDEKYVEPFLEFLQKHWCGEWKKLE
jgi:hypothetical protein